MPFPDPTDKVTTWLATDETHHQVECLFSLATMICIILPAIRVA